MPAPTPADAPAHAEADLADPGAWRRIFDEPAPLTVGVEEEVMVLDGDTLDLAPCAAALVGSANDRRHLRGELPAAQLELCADPAAGAAEATQQLRTLRARAAALAADQGLRLAAAGVHPFADPIGVVSEGERYARLVAEHGDVIRRQLVFGLHVHVCLRGADRALAVYDALRGHLPELAALAAHGPLHDGKDTGLASIRPRISALLPRQGVPPAFGTWEALAAVHAWGRASGRVPDASSWWWEARLHPRWGTIEVRVPDAQATAEDAGAVAAVVHALVAHLAARSDAGEPLGAAPDWRIAENRWAAARDGADATLFDLRTGEPRPARERLHALLDDLAPHARALGGAEQLEHARTLVDDPPARRLRERARDGGPQAATAWLASRFTGPGPG